ncbi:hypothetical protein QUW57_03760 [Phocaeicola plebeius]|uniref:hypothetical protein n=1 Tax=Phocaeicola plebeius TaxID=310297 RepID=UPI0021ACB306|nr:hypothetical protein [Phocaeicola plebeius]MCR8882356.1 hypothetical protein [Phocaeicola plebeius]MDM8285711.1 hypothetical protein [Phocaeicola plebeius]
MLYGVLAAGLLALGGCSPSAVDGPAGVDSSCRVAFRLGGAAGKASSRMGTGESVTGGELQTNLEKQVNSLLAVIFKDADPLGDTEDNANDKFFRTVKIDLGEETDPVIEGLSFLVGDEGNYQVIFVANADADLAGKINALEKDVSTVQTLKNLEVSQSPDTKPGMLMTSGFIRFRSSLVEAVDLGTVYLRRIMSRIDLINMADGVTVTRAVLHNRTVKSLLCNDGTLQVNGDYIGDTEEYTIEPALAGNMTNPAKYEAEIYSYEQLADNTQGTLQPSVDVYYTRSDKGEQLFKHTVSLKVPKSDADGAALVPIGLKRNNAYLIYIRTDAGDIRFTIKVEDWVEGETFTVTDEELSEGAFGIPTAPGEVSIGDWTPEEGDDTDIEANS